MAVVLMAMALLVALLLAVAVLAHQQGEVLELLELPILVVALVGQAMETVLTAALA